MEDLGDDCRINYYDKEGRLTNTQLVKRVKGTLKAPARRLVFEILKKENVPSLNPYLSYMQKQFPCYQKIYPSKYL